MISISGGNSIDISALDTDDQNLAEVLAQGNNGNNLEMVNINGIRVGSASSPGSWGVYVNGISYVSGRCGLPRAGPCADLPRYSRQVQAGRDGSCVGVLFASAGRACRSDRTGGYGQVAWRVA